MRAIILACLVLAGTAAKAGETLPNGRWTVEKVNAEKNTDGKIEKAVYLSASEVKSHIPCVQEMVVDGQKITLRYPDGSEETADYSLDGKTLIINIITGQRTYTCDIKSGTMTLTAVYNYVYNDLSAKRSDNITETRILTFKTK